MAAKDARAGGHPVGAHVQILCRCAHGVRNGRQHAHAFLDDVIEKRQLRERLFSRRITAEDGVEFVHQLVHYGRMLRQKEKCPAERARGGFETGHEKDGGLTNQLGVGHAVIFLIAGCHQERQHIVVLLGVAAPFRNHGENFIFDLFGQP